MTSSSTPAPDVVVIGAGIVGAACALAATRAGLRVVVVDRGAIGGGTSSGGEGNLLVSDKPAGPELDLALHSLGHWEEITGHLQEVTGRPGGGFEFEHKGGLMVASRPETLPVLADLAEGQRSRGVEAVPVDADRLQDAEPHLAPGLAGGMLYPQDGQLQPVMATAALLAAARHHGAVVRPGTTVTGLLRDGDRVTGVELDGVERLSAAAVVNAAGPWSGAVAALAGVDLPVLPRRGVVLVTQPLPPLIRRKVYAAEYVSDVASDRAGLESSAVVEGTPSGTVLIGASRERVGFTPGMPVHVVRRLVTQAVALFPVLAGVRLLRTYHGFRPYCPDHLPVIGEDPRTPGLVHACGHEGAGVVLAAGTGQLVAEVLAGGTGSLDLSPFRPERFSEVAFDGWRMADSFDFDGRTIPFRPGQSVGAALWAAGERTVRSTRTAGTPRGVFCGIGVCYDCLVVVDDVPDQRACVTPASARMRVSTQHGQPLPPPDGRAPDAEEHLEAEVVVIGGGPAGMAAAVAAGAGGARVVLLDSEARLGGQYWRHGPAGVGAQHHGLDAWHALSAGVSRGTAAGTLEVRSRHRVWRVHADDERAVTVHAVTGGPERPDGVAERAVTVSAAAVVIATGAHDRVLPFPGWDLPGVLTAGGAQALLKEHDVVAGRRVVVAGTGPFLLSLAAGLVHAGAEVAGVYEAGDARGWARRWRSATSVPQALIEGAQYAATLARQRVPVRARHSVVAARGRDRLEAVEVVRLNGAGRAVPGSARWVRCDALATGWGFTPRLELAQQVGCAVGVSTAVGPAAGPAVIADIEGRTAVPAVFVAGEVGGVGGASLAEVTGRLAGAAAAAWARGVPVALDGADLARRRRLAGFAATMHAAHPVPVGWLDALTDDTVVCRCEEVDAGRLREAVRELGAGDPRTAKLLTRCGMGWCQGRICGDGVARVVSDATGRRTDHAVDSRSVASPVRLGSLIESCDE